MFERMLNALNLERALFNFFLNNSCFALGRKLDFTVLVTEKADGYLLGITAYERCVYSPVFLGNESSDFLLTLGNYSRRNRLNSSAGKTAFEIFPKHLAELEADESVKNSSRLLRINEVGIDFSRILYRFLYRTLGNFVKRNALCCSIV